MDYEELRLVGSLQQTFIGMALEIEKHFTGHL